LSHNRRDRQGRKKREKERTSEKVVFLVTGQFLGQFLLATGVGAVAGMGIIHKIF